VCPCNIAIIVYLESEERLQSPGTSEEPNQKPLLRAPQFKIR
jgi:hypothetical protein